MPNLLENKIYFLITISAQQKTAKVEQDQINDVIKWLQYSGVHIVDMDTHTDGKYNQLHWHGICYTKRGFYYKPYTQYGTTQTHNVTFRVHWEKITTSSLINVIKYIHQIE